MLFADIYDKYCQGDKLTDAEVKTGEEFFTKLASDLRKAGPMFRLAANEANRVSDGLAAYHLARKLSERALR